jgi:hypothetical protein
MAGLSGCEGERSVTRWVAVTAALTLVLFPTSAQASVLLSSWDFAASGLGDFSQAGSLARFDASLGGLQKVYLGLDARGNFAIEFNQAGSGGPVSQLYRAAASVRSQPLGMAGENEVRTWVSSPTAPDRGSLATSARITSHATFTPAEWAAFLQGLPPGETIAFTLAGSLSAGVAGSVSYDTDLAGQPLANGMAGRLYVQYVFEPSTAGDANGDGRVDLSDFGLVKSAFGATGPAAEPGDLNGDLRVDLLDFGELKLGVRRQLELDAAAAVPEPAAWVLAAAAILALWLVGRSRR